jgi:hypothetical protein
VVIEKRLNPIGRKMITKEERKYIETIIWRTNQEVIKVMKKIPCDELYGWKEDEKN